MRAVATLPTAEAAEGADLGGRDALVIDVLRATTTLAFAFHHGAAEAWPAADIPSALRLADRLDHSEVLLCGERGGLRIPGFHLGNSPLEYTRERVAGRVLVFASTNGSRALRAARFAGRTATVAPVNASAAARWLLGSARPVSLVCSGEAGEESPEDLLGAGALLERLLESGPGFDLDALSQRCLGLFRAARPDLAAAMRAAPHAGVLAKLGFGADVDLAASLDALDSLPVMRDGRLCALAAEAA